MIASNPKVKNHVNWSKNIFYSFCFAFCKEKLTAHFILIWDINYCFSTQYIRVHIFYINQHIFKFLKH